MIHVHYYIIRLRKERNKSREDSSPKMAFFELQFVAATLLLHSTYKLLASQSIAFLLLEMEEHFIVVQ